MNPSLEAVQAGLAEHHAPLLQAELCGVEKGMFLLRRLPCAAREKIRGWHQTIHNQGTIKWREVLRSDGGCNSKSSPILVEARGLPFGYRTEVHVSHMLRHFARLDRIVSTGLEKGDPSVMMLEVEPTITGVIPLSVRCEAAPTAPVVLLLIIPPPPSIARPTNFILVGSSPTSSVGDQSRRRSESQAHRFMWRQKTSNATSATPVVAAPQMDSLEPTSEARLITGGGIERCSRLTGNMDETAARASSSATSVAVEVIDRADATGCATLFKTRLITEMVGALPERSEEVNRE